LLIYLVRHAIADYTTTTPYGTMPGPPLTPEGEEQARAAAVLLERSGLERVVASPMRRCVQTAAAISALCGLETQFDDDLGEMQAKESAGEMTVRMMRAALAQTDASVVALVSHAAPLENLTLTLTRNEFVLPPKDNRGAHVGVGQVWQLILYGGRWHAEYLPVGGVRV